MTPRTVAGLIALVSIAQIVALSRLPPPNLPVAILTAALITTILFIAELIRAGPETWRRPLSASLAISTIALAAGTGPALAGLVTLVATGPLLLLTSGPRTSVLRLFMDIAASIVAANVLWLVERSVDPPLPLAIPIGTAIVVGIVVLLARVPGSAHWETGTGSAATVALFLPAILAATTFEALLATNRTLLPTVTLIAVLVCLTITAGAVSRGRKSTARAVDGLVAALDHRHPDTGAHSSRVFALVSRMLDEVPGLEPSDREAILTAALIHDIGKVATPDTALLKAGALTTGERAIMQRHPTVGEEIVRRLGGLEATAPIVRHHHERWDGAGYPDGLAGPGIPLGARLIAVADTYDTITHDRVYRQAMSHQEAVAELLLQRGRQFDPTIVDIFFRAISPDLDPLPSCGT